MTRWCIIGAGGIADRRTIPALLSDSENVLVAVMDKTPTSAERVGKKYGVPFYTDEAKMLAECECDAVYIATPTACHYDQAMLVLQHGHDVFIEKPLAMTGEESRKIVNAYKKAKKLIFVGYMMKYHNLHKKAKSLVQDGKIGTVSSIRLQFSCWYPDITGAWRQKRSLGGGGAFMDLGVHCAELAEFILGEEIAEIKSFVATNTFSYEVEDSAVVVFKTVSGILGHIDVNFNVPDAASESKLEIYGSDGYIICRGTLGQEEIGKMSYLYAPQGAYDAAQSRTVSKPRNFNGAKGDIYLKQLQDFTKKRNNKRHSYFYADRAVHIQELVDKVYSEN